MKAPKKKTAYSFKFFGKKFQVMTYADSIYDSFKVDTNGNIHIFFKRFGGKLSGSTLSVEAIRQQLPLYFMEVKPELSQAKVTLDNIKIRWNKFISKLFFVK